MLLHMPYSRSPYLPQVRRDAVNLIRMHCWGVRQTARHLSVSPGTISKWLKRASSNRQEWIFTRSSAPHHQPGRISKRLEAQIVTERTTIKRCGQVVYESLKRRGIEVSLSTVHRVLKRNNLVRSWGRWKKRHPSLERPKPLMPGVLVELDTIHLIMKKPYVRLYVYTLIDVYSRWAYAEVSEYISAQRSVEFVQRAQRKAPFPFQMLQSDHGSEFSAWFTNHVSAAHRHIRVRKPNDNAHVERFNRSIQDECLRTFPVKMGVYQKEIPRYLARYNGQRLHMGIGFLTPVEKLATVFPS